MDCTMARFPLCVFQFVFKWENVLQLNGFNFTTHTPCRCLKIWFYWIHILHFSRGFIFTVDRYILMHTHHMPWRPLALTEERFNISRLSWPLSVKPAMTKLSLALPDAFHTCYEANVNICGTHVECMLGLVLWYCHCMICMMGRFYK